MSEDSINSGEPGPEPSDPGMDAPDPGLDAPEAFDVIYSCLRCGTDVPNSELARLPEIKCICGFRVFTKSRPPVVKSVKAL